MSTPLEEAAKKGMAEQFKKNMPSIDTSALNAALNGAGGLGGMAESAAKMAQEAAGKASAVFQYDLPSLAATFPNAAKELFGSADPLIGKTSSFAEDVNKGKKETQAKMNTFLSGSSEAILEPVAFFTKPIMDVMKGSEAILGGQGEGSSLFGGMSDLGLSKLSKATGSLFSGLGDVTKAIYDTTSGLAGQIAGGMSGLFSGGKSVLGGIGGVLEPITSGLGEFTGTLMGGVKSTLGAVYGIPTSFTSGIIDGLNLGLGGGQALLPARFTNMIKGKANSAILGAINGFMSDKLGTVGKVMNVLEGVTDASDALSMILGMGGDYPNQTVNGRSATSIFGRNRSSAVSKLYSAAKKICANVNMPGFVDYGSNKDMYDILMQLAAQMGLTDLMKQLAACAGGDNNYYDNRTAGKLQQYLRKSAYNGDPYTYRTLQETLGKQYVTDPIKDSRVLAANMAYNEPEEKSTWSNILDFFGGSSRKLAQPDDVALYEDFYTGKYMQGRSAPVRKARAATVAEVEDTPQPDPKDQFIDGMAVVFMTSSNTGVMDEALGRDLRVLTQAAVMAYAA